MYYILVSFFFFSQLRRTPKPTPPTPVQSLQDLSILGTSPPTDHTPSSREHPLPVHHSSPSISTSMSPPTNTESIGQPSGVSVPVSGALDGKVRGDLTSGSSGELELKQSQFSPMHSKRSLSADTVKRFLTSQLENEGDNPSRVISAGNGRKDHSNKGLNSQVESKKRKDQRSVADGQPLDSRKSSADLPFWKSDVVPLLHDLESTPYQQVECLCTSCSSLWACLKGHGLLGRTGGVGGTKRRNTVLKTVFKLLDHKDPKLLLKVAKIIVAVSCFWQSKLDCGVLCCGSS